MNSSNTLPLFWRACLETSVSKGPVSFLARAKPTRANSMELHQLKRRLLRAVLEATPDIVLYKRFCAAANQAADLAWSTAHPLLVFPCLFEELAHQVRQQ
jgi:hypothetical protein